MSDYMDAPASRDYEIETDFEAAPPPAEVEVTNSEPISMELVGNQKLPKEAIIVALFGTIFITAGAVAALAYNAIVHSGSTDGLTTIAAVGAGGLVAALGAHQRQP